METDFSTLSQGQYAAEMLEKYILMANSALLKMKTVAGGDRGDDNGSISRSTVLAVSPPASHAASAQQGPIGANGHIISTDLPTGVAEGTPAMSKSSARTPRSHLLRLIKIQEGAWSPSSKATRKGGVGKGAKRGVVELVSDGVWISGDML